MGRYSEFWARTIIGGGGGGGGGRSDIRILNFLFFWGVIKMAVFVVVFLFVFFGEVGGGGGGGRGWGWPFAGVLWGGGGGGGVGGHFQNRLYFWGLSKILGFFGGSGGGGGGGYCKNRGLKHSGRPRWLSWMRRTTGDQEVAGSTPAEVGNILSWRLIVKYFLRSFPPFR